MLREYQVEDRSRIFDGWRESKSLMYRLDTGGGKTVIVTDVVKDFLGQDKRVVFIAHREELITQAFNTFYKNQIYSGIIKGDIKPNYSLKSQIASIQTLVRRKNLPDADVIIIDECHHAVEDNSYGKIISERWPNALILGVTATPYRLNGKGFTKMFDVLIESSVTRHDLINMGFLVGLKYYAAFNPDLSNVDVERGEYNEEQTVKVMEMAPIVESYFDHCRDKTGLVFAVNVDHSNRVVNMYREAGVRAAHIDAKTPTEERRRVIRMLKEREISVISNVGIATEGFDMPNLDFVQLARPTMSLSLLCQMVGRAVRVDNDVIKGLPDDESRLRAIQYSSKPHGIILDNAGMYKKHRSLITEITTGAPIDWKGYFQGWSKRKKEITDMIEIEYIAEDEQGNRVVGKTPEEIQGMRLIEINELNREAIIGGDSIMHEFERLYETMKRLPRVDKVGFTSFFKFMEVCKGKNIRLSDNNWDHLTMRLVTQHKEYLSKEKEKSDLLIQGISEMYNDNVKEAEKLANAINNRHNALVEKVSKLTVPSGFLRSQRKKIEEEQDLQQGKAS